MKVLLHRFVREPLLHFTILGAILFGVYIALNPDQLEPDTDVKTLVVDEAGILRFLQFRLKSFDDEKARTQFQAMSAEDNERLIQAYIREEVLYREAIALNLDQSDYVIKRRLIQKLDFIAEGFADAVGAPSEDQVRKYYEEQKQKYHVAPWVTFTHVFFDAKRLGNENAMAEASRTLTVLNREKAKFSDAPKYGSRFPYNTNYVEKPADLVASHFGKAMTAALFELQPSKVRWHGPYRSPFGHHLVMLVARQEGKVPTLEDVRGRVEEDARRALVRERTDQAVQKIIDSYTIDNRLNASVKAAK